jgi:hypothetical protein
MTKRFLMICGVLALAACEDNSGTSAGGNSISADGAGVCLFDYTFTATPGTGNDIAVSHTNNFDSEKNCLKKCRELLSDVQANATAEGTTEWSCVYDGKVIYSETPSTRAEPDAP